MTHVMAIDPGLATGIALWDDSGYFETLTLHGGLVGAMEFLDGTIHAPAWDVFVMETFTIGQQDRAMTKKGQSETIEIIGAVKWAVHHANKVRKREGVWRQGKTLPGDEHQLTLAMQSPSDAVSFSTNDKLRVVGFNTPSNPDHERSAARHLLLYLARSGAIDTLDLIRSLQQT